MSGEEPDREPAVGETVRFDDVVVEGPVLDVPDPPADLPWAEVEDFRAEQVVRANGVGDDPAALREAATAHPVHVVRAAALHTLGARGLAGEEARALLDHRDDLLRLEAAFALARQGDDAAGGTLVALLELPAGPHLTPPAAAGYLARLGDCRGLAVVERALGHPDTTLRMVACRQLSLLLPCGDAAVWGLFDRALADGAGDVRWQAVVQLSRLEDEEARRRLRQVVASDPDRSLRDAAAAALGED